MDGFNVSSQAISKLIDIDRQARELVEQALTQKQQALAMLPDDSVRMKNAYLQRANARVEKVKEQLAASLNQAGEEIDANSEALSQQMRRQAHVNMDKWAQEIFSALTDINEDAGGGESGG